MRHYTLRSSTATALSQECSSSSSSKLSNNREHYPYLYFLTVTSGKLSNNRKLCPICNLVCRLPSTCLIHFTSQGGEGELRSLCNSSQTRTSITPQNSFWITTTSLDVRNLHTHTHTCQHGISESVHIVCPGFGTCLKKQQAG